MKDLSYLDSSHLLFRTTSSENIAVLITTKRLYLTDALGILKYNTVSCAVLCHAVYSHGSLIHKSQDFFKKNLDN